MTLADRCEAVLLERGPLPGCELAPAVRKQKSEVLAVLHGNPDRFVLTGKARASRWSVREVTTVVDGFIVDELAARWGNDLVMGRLFVRDFLAAGYLESVNGNGRIRPTRRAAELFTEIREEQP